MSERKNLQLVIHEFLLMNKIKFIMRENNQHQQKYRHTATKKYDGIPDDIIFMPSGTVILFEYKVGGNKLNKRQVEWKEYLINYQWYEIRDVKSAIDIIKGNL